MFQVKWIFLFQIFIYRYEWRNESWSYYLVNPAGRVSVIQSDKFNMHNQTPGDIDLVMATKVQLLVIHAIHFRAWTTDPLWLLRSEHNKEWSVLIMKKKHKRIRVKFFHMKTWHNGVDEDWRCFFYMLGKFQLASQGSRKGRNLKSPRLQLFRAG